MKSKPFFVIILALSGFSICAKAQSETSGYEPETFVTKEGILPYRILFPQNFDSNGKYPLILVFRENQ
jgi:hypothetical protein